MLIIGSLALNYWGISTNRPIGDMDIIGTYSEYQEFVKTREATQYYPLSGKKMFIRLPTETIVEWEIAWEGSTGESLLNMTGANIQGATVYADPNVCYALKMSHRYLRNNPHFKKTMSDIRLLREEGCVIPEEFYDFDWMGQREEETYDYGHPKLNQSKKNFFDTEGVEYKYDHDSIHQAVKHLDKPAYTYFKPHENEVYCSKDLFFKQDKRVQLYSVLEEAYVLAIERSLVPFEGVLNTRQAFTMALEKVCTSIASGWWREFAWEHYHEVRELFDQSYYTKFKTGLTTGVVKLHDSTNTKGY